MMIHLDKHCVEFLSYVLWQDAFILIDCENPLIYVKIGLKRITR